MFRWGIKKDLAIRNRSLSFSAMTWCEKVLLRKCGSLDLGAFQGKSSLGLDADMDLKAQRADKVSSRMCLAMQLKLPNLDPSPD